MVDGIGVTARALGYYMRRQEIAAQNLSHLGGTAYKGVRAAAAGDGYGAPTATEWTDWSSGTIRETGRPFDMALSGSGFLVVDTPAGERLSRGGSFQLDAGGRLIDQGGHPLLGEQGPIFVAGSRFEVATDGTILVDGAVQDRLRMESPDPNTLGRGEGDLYSRNGATPAPADPALTVRQGELEGANIDPVVSMVDMVAIQRSYAANIQVMKVIDRVMGVAASEVGDV